MPKKVRILEMVSVFPSAMVSVAPEAAETLRLSEHAQLLDRDVSERAGLVDRRHRSACVW